jgi:uncharacterized protein
VYVGVCRVELDIPAAESIKDKRAVLQSTMVRVRNKFRVSIAEVDAQDHWRTAVLGIAAVSNDAIHARQVLDRVVQFLEHARLDADVGVVDIEILDAL